MKNKEKYEKEIMNIACNGDSIAVIKKSGRIVSCNGTKCCLCLFHDSDCSEEKIREWAESECTEKPVISKRDREFLGYIREEYKFVARDENGKLFIYETQPRKGKTYWYLTYDRYSCLNRYYNVDFPMVKWSDEEPWLIEDLKKLEVVEEYE